MLISAVKRVPPRGTAARPTLKMCRRHIFLALRQKKNFLAQNSVLLMYFYSKLALIVRGQQVHHRAVALDAVGLAVGL